MADERVVVLSDSTRLGGETGAGLMRNRCAFTSRDMAEDWTDAFTYAVVFGWRKKAMKQMAARYGWDDELIAFLRDVRKRFKRLADNNTVYPYKEH